MVSCWIQTVQSWHQKACCKEKSANLPHRIGTRKEAYESIWRQAMGPFRSEASLGKENRKGGHPHSRTSKRCHSLRGCIEWIRYVTESTVSCLLTPQHWFPYDRRGTGVLAGEVLVASLDFMYCRSAIKHEACLRQQNLPPRHLCFCWH